MATETLRPNADVAGLVNCSIYPTTPTTHYDKVDEETSDDDSTYVYKPTGSTGQYDFYDFPSHSVGSGTINKVTVIVVARNVGATTPQANARYHPPGGGYYNNTAQSLTASYVAKSFEWANNPATGVPWTWAEVDAGQFAPYLLGSTGGTVRCTQVYVEIDYTVVGEDLIKNLSDTITITDATVKAIAIARSDTMSIADSIVKGIGLVKADAISISDAVSKAVSLVKADTVAIADSFSYARGLFKTLTDTISITDSLAKTIGLIKAETISLSDSFAKQVEFFRTIADSVGITDAVSKTINLIKVDTVAVADSFSYARGLFKTLTDSVAITDSFSKAIGFYRTLTDSITITDSFSYARGLFKTLTDSVAITDTISKAVGLVKSDIIRIIDKFLYKPLKSDHPYFKGGGITTAGYPDDKTADLTTRWEHPLARIRRLRRGK